ncbi:CRISPR system Cascade subunit CasD [Actinoalloteichus hoggarensis]|uniref:CRISPR system Cascade subunit CasD n=1 Tax=Actinoalloteichus hoggarensis TaxID=1470176 RepID=A0A221W807_9PSEU|nr:type I-E CRISPR-associated protein Cas5/CasD [Actinoalloteichus hoggarensis]ASO21801.1 CRISPR system Cascade subunit CasD [Actinoalloteichus hoggarensis]MBB5922398.1 CRISPR system Cascade subunit CasD [Actinoalloteichus hoggarensis]
MTLSLAVCFDAPMQSWGTRSAYIKRDTAREPTKSGVVGVVASAMGIDRDDRASIAALAELRLGVRVDREGLLEVDFHTAQNVPNTEGGGHRTVVSHRYHLSDALFLVVLAGEGPEQEALLLRAEAALRSPAWPLFFGRKAFVPSRPLLGEGSAEAPSGWGLSERSPAAVLHEHPWLETGVNRARISARLHGAGDPDPPPPLRAVIDCDATDKNAEIRSDHPLSFARGDRRFASRSFTTLHIPLTPAMISPGDRPCS